VRRGLPPPHSIEDADALATAAGGAVGAIAVTVLLALVMLALKGLP
jgi:hypothetical protein